MNGTDPVEGFARHLAARGRADGTVRLRVFHVRRFLSATGCDPHTVTTAQVEDYLAAQEWKANTYRSAITSLSGFFEWLRPEDDPAAALTKPKAPPPCPKPVAAGIVSEALAGATGLELLLIRLAINTGLRRGELAAIHSDDVELAAGTWWLRTTGKGAKTRRVPIPASLARDIRAAEGYVFPGRFGGHVEVSWIYKRLRCALQGHSPHTARHAYATGVYRRTRDIRAVQTLLGHASVATTELYVATTDDELVAAASSVWSE